MKPSPRHIATCAVLGAAMLSLSALCLFAPKDTYSEDERRALASFPSLTPSSIMSGRFMDQFETYAQDAFPFRDAFRSIKALASEGLFFKMDNNDLYTVQVESLNAEGDAHKQTSIVALEYPLDEKSVIRATERFTYVYEQYLQNNSGNIFVSVVPDKGYYLAEPSGHVAMDYQRLFALVEKGMPYATYIDITDTLDGTSYYLTDPHWNQESLLGTAAVLLENMLFPHATQVTDPANSTMTFAAYLPILANDAFYGSYYGQAALPVQPDTLVMMSNDTIDGSTAYDHENDRTIPIYDLLKAAGQSENGKPADPYEAFLGGSLSLVTIENTQADTDREIIIFRDSFASSLAPLLLEGYAKITLVDIRYIQPAMLGNFIDFEDADILFLHSTSVLNNSETIL